MSNEEDVTKKTPMSNEEDVPGTIVFLLSQPILFKPNVLIIKALHLPSMPYGFS